MMYAKFEQEMKRRAENMTTWGRPVGMAFPKDEENEDIFFVYEDETSTELLVEMIPITLAPELFVQLRKVLKKPLKVFWYNGKKETTEDYEMVTLYHDEPFIVWQDSSYSNCFTEFLKPFMYGCWK